MVVCRRSSRAKHEGTLALTKAPKLSEALSSEVRAPKRGQGAQGHKVKSSRRSGQVTATKSACDLPCCNL